MITMSRTIILLLAFFLLPGNGITARVIGENDRIYIEDRTGTRWDVTESRRFGFVPQKFQYGIGKDAFTPLHDGDFTNTPPSTASAKRVIGVTVDGRAHAYSVQRLMHHEIANTTIAGQAITAGY